MITQRIIITGATSGMGRLIAEMFARKGWQVGAAGRRTELLDSLKQEFPQNIETEAIDITSDDASEHLNNLIDKLGGMDIYLHCSGIGFRNMQLEPDKEISTLRTNGEGFTRMVDAAFNYFAAHNGGHIAVISSIAGVKGLGPAPAYSATKRFQNTYIDALEQMAHVRRLNIGFTDIRPGFVRTALIHFGNDGYPMVMEPDFVAKKIVKAIIKKRRVAVIDWRYAVMVRLWRLLPRWLWKRFPIAKAD